MDWFLLALLAGIIGQAFLFINRFTLRGGGDSTAYAWWFESFRLILFSILASFNFKFIYNTKGLVVLLSLGLVEVLAIYYFMKMHAFTELSLSTIITRLRLVFTAIIAWVLLHERLTWFEYIGIVLVCLGLILVIQIKKIKQDKGIKSALLFSVLSAFFWVLMKAATQYASNSIVIAFTSAPSVLLLPLLMKQPIKRIKKTWEKYHTNMFFSVASDAGGLLLMTSALRIGSASKVLTVHQSMMIVGVLAGILLLKETKMIWRKVVGSLITLIGLWMLIY